MDFQPKTNEEDQDLAKALAGIMNEDDANATSDENEYNSQAIQVEDGNEVSDVENREEISSNESENNNEDVKPVQTEVNTPSEISDLESIKRDALIELKPLIEKIELTPEERFDLYLLMLRVTDDAKLIAPAHKTALNITDEVKRAQALLDIIKEIDYLSSSHPVSL